MVGLSWWASLSYACVCLREFHYLVSGCLYVLNHHLCDSNYLFQMYVRCARLCRACGGCRAAVSVAGASVAQVAV